MLRTALAQAARPIRVPASRLAAARQLHVSASRCSLTNLFDMSDAPPLAVNKLTPAGFHLSDGLVVPGGLVFVDGRVLLWDVDPPADASGGIEQAWAGWTAERFKVFERVVPRPEILLFGTGKSVIPAPKAVRDYVSSLGIQLDVMDSTSEWRCIMDGSGW